MSLLYLVLSDVSICYPSLRGKFFTRYSPVRHDTFYRSRSSHRLACVKHSVSVHPEPGSNSSFNSCYFLLHLILYPFFNIFASSSYVFIVLANSHWQNKYYHTYLYHVNYFFTLFSTFFISLPLSTISPPLSLTNTIYCVVINKKMHLQC